MKQIFTILAALLIGNTVFAFNGASALVIDVNNVNKVQLIIDGKLIPLSGEETMIPKMREGYHTVQIMQARFIRVMDGVRYNWQTIYNDNLYFQDFDQWNISVNRIGKVTVTEQKTNQDEQHGWMNHGEHHHYEGYDNGCSAAMNGRAFSQLLQAIQAENFESTKIKLANFALEDNYISVSQLKAMLSLFSFESSKLDLAKEAYCKVVDPRNYYQLMDVFVFGSSKDELMDFIRSHK